MTDTNLSERILTRADKDGLAVDHPLRKQALLFSEVVGSKESSAKKILGTWARTRRMWSEYSGEPLI